MSIWIGCSPIDSVTKELQSHMCGDGYEERMWTERYLLDLFFWLVDEPRNLDSVRSRLDEAVAESKKNIGQCLAFDFITEAIDGVVVAAAEHVRHHDPYYSRLLVLLVAAKVSI